MNVTDYLLKPFDFERFLVAVTKVKTAKTAIPVNEEAQATKDHLFLNVQKKKVKILFQDIIYIESQREYIKIVTSKGEYLSKMSTHEIEDLLPPSQFKRIHRSYIISLSKIDSYTSEEVEVSGISIPIGRGYREGMDWG
jgi:DNA-binding LytR/AlgR family response regulator